MFSAILFAGYFAFFAFAFTVYAKRWLPEVNSYAITGIYGWKVLMGCCYGYLFLKYYGGDDTWMYFQNSVEEYHKLIDHPGAFFSDLLPGPSFSVAHGFWQGMFFYRQDLEWWLMVKMLAVFNLFSGSNYYVDVLFFECITTTGLLLLFQLLRSEFATKKNALLVIVFGVPSIAFWLSGIRAEGLLVFFIGVLLYYTHCWFEKRKVFYFFFIILAFAGLCIFRTSLLVIFFPAFFSWTISRKNLHEKNSLVYFSTVYIVVLLLFFGSMLVSPGMNLATPIVQSQHNFLQLKGNTRYALDALQPTIGSFLSVLPQAIANTFLRPYIWEAHGVLQVLAALQTMGIWIIFALIIFFHRKNRDKRLHPLLLLFVFFACSQLILIGYVVPFPGAIVRYRSIPELFLLLFAIMKIRTDLQIIK